MAMDGDKLGKEIADVITHSGAPADVKVAVLDLWQKIGRTIVAHIQTNAVVPSGITVSTTGGGGSTTGTGKVT